MKTPSFAHGTTYYHFANPPEELAENFAKMVTMGLNTVRVAEVWPGWEVLEPEPGRFAFDLLDDYVAKASAAGLGIVMGIGINNPPFWVFTDLDDVRCVDVSGKVATRRIQSANHDHPEYRRLMERFIEAHVRRYAANAAVVAWQFGNEMRYGVELADNACTRVRFRGWLRERFGGDLAELNRRWGVHYRSWEEVYPYQSRAGAPTQGLSPLAIATRGYQAWSLEELKAWGAAIVRRHSALPVFHNNFGVSGVNGSHWTINRVGDMVVQDIYPTMSPNPRAYNAFLLDCASSMARSQRKAFWVGETSIGQYGTLQRDKTGAALVETLVMEMIGAGASGVLYFRHKSPRFEQPHKFTGSQGALRRDGSELPYAETPRRVAQVMARLGERILAARPVTPEVGVYYPEESCLFSMDAGYRAIQGEVCYGASGLWGRLGYPVHVLPTRELREEDLSGLKVIYVPLSYLLPAAVGERLKRYVREGGVLISELRPGYVNEDGWLYEEQPGAGLVEVFGAREDLFWNAASMKVTARCVRAEYGFACPAAFQSFRLFGAEAIAHSGEGEIVGVQHAFGKGRAILLGFSPALLFPLGGGKYESASSFAGSTADQEAALGFIGALAAQAGARPPVNIALPHRQIALRHLESKRERLLFLMNYGPAAEVALPRGYTLLARGGAAGLDLAPKPPASMPTHSWIIAAEATG